MIVLFSLSAHAYSPLLPNGQKDDFYAIVNAGVLNGESSIDISQFGISTQNIDRVINSYVWENPEYSFCIISKSYRHTNGTVLSLSFQYDNKATIKSRHQEINDKISSIVVNINPEFNEIEKIAWINDYICDTFQYDIVTEHHTIDKLLSSEKGICEAYANLFTAICNKIGIESSYCYSNEIQHIWNMVKINGQWYHVDTTWNDSYAERYEYFLLSDEAMRSAVFSEKGVNFNMNAIHSATSTNYDHAFWRDGIYSSIERIGNVSYLVKDWKLYTVNWNNFTIRQIASLNSDKWAAPGASNNYYISCFTDIEAVGKVLLYTTPNGVRKYDTVNNTDTLAHAISTGGQVASIRAVEAGFEIRLNSDFTHDITTKKTLSDRVYIVEYIVGGKTCLIQYYLYEDQLVIPSKVLNHNSVISGWSLQNGQVIRTNLTNTATIEHTSTGIVVQFKVDDVVVKQETLTLGDIIVAPANPSKASDSYNHYLFIEWDGYKNGMKAIEDKYVFNAVFSEVKRTYSISFYSNDILIKEEIVDAGTTIQFPDVQDSIIKNGKTYKFVGWDTQETIVSDSMIINAVYAEANKKCTITYYVDNTVFFTQTVDAGDVLKYPDLQPIKQSDKYQQFIFDGWTGGVEGDFVMHDMNITASFKAEPLENTQQSINDNESENKGLFSFLNDIPLSRIFVVVAVVAIIILAWYMLFKRNS